MKTSWITLVGATLSWIAWGQSVPLPIAAVDNASTSLESLLQTKVVTASRFSENLADAPGVMTVVTRAEIDRFGGLTLREILNRVAGLSLVSNTFTDRSIASVRGEQAKDNGSHVLYLINGRPTREVLEGGVMTELLEAFPVGILERIEVIEGPGSVLYGSNAYSGVINLITQKGQSNALVMRGFGSGAGPNGGSAEGTIRKGAFRLSAAAQFHQETRWTTPVWPDLGGGFTLPAQSFTMYDRSRAVFVEAEYRGFSAMFATMDRRSPFEAFGFSGDTHWRRTFADLGYDAKPRPHWDMGLHVTYTGTGLDSNALPVSVRRGGEMELNWTNSVAVNERVRVTFGVLYDYQFGREVDNFGGPTFTATDATRSSGAVYGQVEYRLMDGLSLIGGVQTNKVDHIKVDTVPRAGLMWSPFSRWHVKALYAEAFRAPSLNEVHTQYSPIVGNVNLLPELSTTFDLGVIYQARRLQTSINYFQSQQQDNIVAVKTGRLVSGFDSFQYQNVTGLRFQGLQWESKWYLRPQVLAEGSALYQTNQDSNGTSVKLPTAAFGAKAGLSYADKQGWTFGLFDVYSGAIPGFAITPNPKPGPHHLLTANVRLRLDRYLGPMAKCATAFVHGDNLTNRAVWLPAWGYSSASTLPFERGRAIYYGIEFAFRRD